MRLKIDFDIKNLKVNRVARFFILADFLLFGGWGFIGPVFAVFVLNQVPGSTLLTLGIVAAIYWIVKSVIQIPVALYLDHHDGERDDFNALVLSLMLAGFAAISFLLVHSTPQLYLVVFLQAVAFGLYTPSWSALFSRHLDREHFSFDWSLDSTSVGIASGITGLLGGAFAGFFGFSSVFIIGSLLSFIGAFSLLSVPNIIFPPKTGMPETGLRDHAPGAPLK